jgi:hypothetical protein
MRARFLVFATTVLASAMACASCSDAPDQLTPRGAAAGVPSANAGSWHDADPVLAPDAPPADASTDAVTPHADADAGSRDPASHNLDVINAYRAMKGVAPLVLDDKLSAFAQAGSAQLSQDHAPHAHFMTAAQNGTLGAAGFQGGAAENQGAPTGWNAMATDPVVNERLQIESIMQAMFAEGPGAGDAHGHYTNLMNGGYHRLGVGLVTISGRLYLTNDFSP